MSSNKKFNINGTCIPEKHFMANVEGKLDEIMTLVDEGEYLNINRPRQYGKTTIQYLLWRRLGKLENYSVIQISFEDIDAVNFESAERFVTVLFLFLKDYAETNNYRRLLELLEKHREVKDLAHLAPFITELNSTEDRLVLLIDEVDKSSDNQLFLDFLGLLRSRYLKQNQGQGRTFHSVILAGVHDVKNLKVKLRPNETQKLNSPWNIAANFEVILSLQPNEIADMLTDYSRERSVTMDVAEISERLYYHTSGYPFLVSRLCKLLDETLDVGNEWRIEHIDQAVALLLKEENTNFESLIKNLEENQDLYVLTEKLLLDGTRTEFNVANAIIQKGLLYGIFRRTGTLRIHNRVYEQYLYNYLSVNLKLSKLVHNNIDDYMFQENYLDEQGNLNFKQVLLKFREFMRKEYSAKDREFLEREGRVIFLAFLRPIINGQGFDFKEVQISEEKRLDIVVVFRGAKFVVELKIWRGPAAHEKGILQLGDYLERQGLEQGYLLIFDFTDSQRAGDESEWVSVGEREVFVVRV